jgi:hypothetical protein
MRSSVWQAAQLDRNMVSPSATTDEVADGFGKGVIREGSVAVGNIGGGVGAAQAEAASAKRAAARIKTGKVPKFFIFRLLKMRRAMLGRLNQRACAAVNACDIR